MTAETFALEGPHELSIYGRYFSDDLTEEDEFPFETYGNSTESDITSFPGGSMRFVVPPSATVALKRPATFVVYVGTPKFATTKDMDAERLPAHYLEPVGHYVGAYPTKTKLRGYLEDAFASQEYDIETFPCPPWVSIGLWHSTHSNMSLEREVDRLFWAASDEQFEVGMVSEFAHGLDDLLAASPIELLHVLQTRLDTPRTPIEVIAEAMHWLGELEHETFRKQVVSILLFGLNHESPVVRDAGALALGDLEGCDALIHLKQAIEKENVPELREDMEDLVESLLS